MSGSGLGMCELTNQSIPVYGNGAVKRQELKQSSVRELTHFFNTLASKLMLLITQNKMMNLKMSIIYLLFLQRQFLIAP